MSINKAVLYLVIAAVLTTTTMIYVAERMQDKPNLTQTAVEAAYDLTSNNITRGNMGSDMAAKWFPFVATLFLFILFSNLIGYIPLPTNTEHKFTCSASRSVVRALRGHREHLGAAGADADRLGQLPRRGHPPPGRQGLLRDLDPAPGSRARPASRSSSSR